MLKMLGEQWPPGYAYAVHYCSLGVPNYSLTVYPSILIDERVTRRLIKTTKIH